MKRQIQKKLTLSKETLRNLSERDLQNAVGGGTANCSNVCTSALCTDGGSCDSFRCGATNYC